MLILSTLGRYARLGGNLGHGFGYTFIDRVSAERGGDILSEAWRGLTPNFGMHQTKLLTNLCQAITLSIMLSGSQPAEASSHPDAQPPIGK